MNHLKIIKKWNHKVIKWSEKCTTQTKRIKAAKKMSENFSFLKTIKGLPDSLKAFMMMQTKAKQKVKGS